MRKRALITGITGQDGSYLAELLLEEGYEVIGMVRRSSTVNFERIAHIQDQVRWCRATSSTRSRSSGSCASTGPPRSTTWPRSRSCQTSWSQPVLTGETTALGVTRVLDAIRIVDPEIRFYQASSSEMFGKVQEVPQNEDDAVLPAQPLRRRQGVRPLDHRQLPRELRAARLVGHPVQPREPAARVSSSSTAR